MKFSYCSRVPSGGRLNGDEWWALMFGHGRFRISDSFDLLSRNVFLQGAIRARYSH